MLLIACNISLKSDVTSPSARAEYPQDVLKLELWISEGHVTSTSTGEIRPDFCRFSGRLRTSFQWPFLLKDGQKSAWGRQKCCCSYPAPLPSLCALDRGGPAASWTGRTRWPPSRGSGRTVSSPQHGIEWLHPAFCSIRRAETNSSEWVNTHIPCRCHPNQAYGHLTDPLCPWDNGLIHVLQLFVLQAFDSLRPNRTPVMNPTTPWASENSTLVKTQFHYFLHKITLNIIMFGPESSRSAARLGESENPMEDRSSFPGWGSGEADGLRVGRSEDGPKCLSSRCPCRLRSTQLQSAQARILSLRQTEPLRTQFPMLRIQSVGTEGRLTRVCWKRLQ